MAKQQSFSLVLVILIILFTTSSSANAAQYNVLTFGAKPDGKTDSTKAFLAAWTRACESIKPATVYAPPGRFFLLNVVFQGPCKNNAILVRVDGTLVAPSDYRLTGNAGNWIFFQYVNGVTVSGGVLDGQGPGLWACKASGNNCPSGATWINILNSQLYHIVINGCQNVKVQGVTVSASGHSPNTDGIHVQLSSGVTILNSRIRTGDDCVSIGAGTTNLWIEKVACGPGHGIRYTEWVKNQVLGRPSNGFARNILFQHAIMTNVQNPMVIDQNYCPDNNNCPGQESGVKISDVTYQDIHGTSATQLAVKFDCSKKNPCTGIKLENVKLTYMNQPADASCNNADGNASGFVLPSSCL
ncbi:hypothetical protein GH714_021105 [Hevea brasiliensis]|uniref:Polygalacturonase n=1 Tax=Hevea brasiliensis TaxID=3981 RepID=A0A6A6LDV5_HEVBR|nr:hypothetical protein GH714_021105 [Hevea brasiliensis]